MRRILAVLLAAVFVLLCSSAAAHYDNLVIPATEMLIQRIEEEYGIHLLVPDSPVEGVFVHGENDVVQVIVHSDDPTEAFNQEYALFCAVKDIYYSALPVFPESFLESFNGKLYVFFVDSIYLGGNDRYVGGYCHYQCDDPNSYLIFNYNWYKPYLIFHESWHAFELRNGLVFPDWESLNPPEFEYILDSANAESAEDFDPEWFYRLYGTVNAEEDRATVFEAFYCEKDQWWEDHPHIKEKLDVMMRAVEYVSEIRHGTE